MAYDENSFLQGIAVGKSMKGYSAYMGEDVYVSAVPIGQFVASIDEYVYPAIVGQYSGG